MYIVGLDIGFQFVECIIGNFNCFSFIFEGSYINYGIKDFFLEYLYFVIVFQDGWYNIVVVLQAFVVSCFVFVEYFSVFFFFDFNVVEDFFVLIV